MGRFWNVWHMWCTKFGDLEKAIETGKCDFHTDPRYHTHLKIELEASVRVLSQNAEQLLPKVHKKQSKTDQAV